MRKIQKSLKVSFIALMILFGALCTISYKFQNKQTVNEGSKFKYFFHPYMQTTLMFFSESLALFVFYSMKQIDQVGFYCRFRKALQQGKQLDFTNAVFAVPALLDLVSSNLRYAGLNFVSASTFQMIRGGNIITTLIFSMLLLKIKPQNCQKIGCALAVVGLTIIGISAMISQQDNTTQDNQKQMVGFFLLIGSLFANGLLYSYEQRLFSKYHIEPLQMVGYQGVFGLIFSVILVVSFSFIPCNFGAEACVILDDGTPVLERPLIYFRQVFDNPLLLLFVILSILGISSQNIVGVTVTRHIGAVSRSMNHISSSILVWIVGLIITMTAGQQDKNYKWESVEWKIILLLFVGFVLLILGNLVYNKIVKLPWSHKDQSQICVSSSYKKVECLSSKVSQQV